MASLFIIAIIKKNRGHFDVSDEYLYVCSRTVYAILIELTACYITSFNLTSPIISKDKTVHYCNTRWDKDIFYLFIRFHIICPLQARWNIRFISLLKKKTYF